MRGAAPSRRIVAYREVGCEYSELAVELFPANAYSLDAFWKEASWVRPGAEGPSKIRAGYDYREPYVAPCVGEPHSVCPGDVFVNEVGDIVFCVEHPG